MNLGSGNLIDNPDASIHGIKDSDDPKPSLSFDIPMDSGSLQIQDNVVISYSPGNSKYYVPICSNELKPFVGQMFTTLKEAYEFYEAYAKIVGFKVRPGSQVKSGDDPKLILWKYLLCSKEGHKSSKSVDKDIKGKSVDNVSMHTQRRTITSRCGCKAKLAIRFQGKLGYCVKRFEERHTHPMIIEEQKQFLRSNRKLTGLHQDFIINCLKSNIGTSKAFKLFKNSVGSYSDVGASYVDFNNFSRDLNAYMYHYDAQMAINNLTLRKERCGAYFFDYAMDDESRLTMLFYSDPISRKSFSFFGDVISADATYKSNRYGMVFVPFTGVDNNKCSITFGYGLLLHEDTSSYVWLFENFKRAMGHDPNVILTDQDGAVKCAVEQVFPNSVHRFCMWHIMFKIPVKVKVDAAVLEDFRKKFNSIVWSDELKPEQFEESWHSIIHEFQLESNTWLQSLYELRHFWIPVFFQDVSMGGLLRTTSRSESQNFFFSSFIGESSCLNVFILQFDNALDSQRHVQRKNDLNSVSCFPSLKTPLAIEQQCASIFTINIFYEVQEEIYSSVFRCSIKDWIKVDSDVQVFHVRSSIGKVHVVTHYSASDHLCCSCNKLLSVGIPCSHLFVVLRTVGKELLPDKYIKVRWTKKAILKPIFQVDGSVFKESTELDEKKTLSFEILSEMHACINAIDDNVELLKDFLGVVKEKKELYIRTMGVNIVSDVQKKRSRFEALLGPIPDQVNVLPPPHAKTKGRPKGKRLKSNTEKIRDAASKEKRTCGRCFGTGHNSRTCSKVL